MKNTIKKVIAIITARGGSKRIPKKNIKQFLGYPIIKYSIEAAIKSKIFDEIMVSTDNVTIAIVSKKFGAKVPFFRSKKNSNDYAMTAEVVSEVIEKYKKINKNFDYVCCIYPTAPFVTAEKLKEAYKVIQKEKADSIIPVVKFSYPIQRSLRIKNGLLQMIWPENLNKRSQDLEPVYHDCGQFYFLKTSSFLKQKKLFMAKTIPLETSEMEVQDIDSVEDWKIAEIKYKQYEKI